ncbi:uncharacterized protein LOC120534425 [Polypterus senegalus]|uniref:uncharacterized protein LOC120534425 n=1 Tax=Polypterus senegalus TaxID=55291 RepID=UPI001964C748|nr:uncharacterized protein LOC120534425 [Polypterus senegalus]
MALSKVSECDMQQETNETVKCFRGLWPKAQKIALLFHLSYLRLGKFPQFESLIRTSAVKSLEVFSESSVLLGKCAVTGQNITTSLFPVLRQAAEISDRQMIETVLQKIETWIVNLLAEVDVVINRIEELKKNVECDSNEVEKEKDERHKNQKESETKTEEIAQHEEGAKKTMQDIENLEKKLADVNHQKQKLIQKIEDRDNLLSTCLAPIPWWLRWLYFAGYCNNSIKAHQKEIENLNEQYNKFKKELEGLQNELASKQDTIFQLQLDLISLNQKAGTAAESACLQNVARHLSAIQRDLGQVKRFWQDAHTIIKGLGSKLEAQKLTAAEFQNYKDIFLESVESSENCWRIFASACLNVKHHFSVDLEQLYRFIEYDVDMLSEVEMQENIQEVQNQISQLSCRPITSKGTDFCIP